MNYYFRLVSLLIRESCLGLCFRRIDHHRQTWCKRPETSHGPRPRCDPGFDAGNLRHARRGCKGLHASLQRATTSGAAWRESGARRAASSASARSSAPGVRDGTFGSAGAWPGAGRAPRAARSGLACRRRRPRCRARTPRRPGSRSARPRRGRRRGRPRRARPRAS